MPPSNCFETGRRSPTQSSVRSFGAETANGCLVLDRRGTTAERREGELERPEDFCLRSSQAHQESSCPLDKDLKEATRDLRRTRALCKFNGGKERRRAVPRLRCRARHVTV